MARHFRLEGRSQSGQVDFSAALNAEQLAVATAGNGPMLVIAGAGSGKTRALTYRLAWLVHRGVDPSRILLVTFTNRAAREMLHRVGVLLQQNTRPVWGGTFHHIANRLLRRHGQALGIDSAFNILDREDAADLLASSVAALGVPVQERRFPQKRVLMSISSAVQNTLASLEGVLNARFPVFSGQQARIEQVLAQYAESKRAAQLLDYDDLLSQWLRLLQDHDDVRDVLQRQFQYILVDEYQDTNAIQGAIVDLLAAQHRNVCVVGDDSQSIYSFRGARFENVLEFKHRYPDAHEYRLETNYRSTPEILALANANVSRNINRLPKVLRAVRPPGLKPARVTCHDHFIQSRFIAEYILHLLDQGIELEDIAVLYRSHWHSPEIQLELQRRNIPYEVRGGLRFFEQAHIKDALAFLRIVANPRDELAWMRTLKLITRVGNALSRRIWLHLATTNDPIATAGEHSTSEILPASVRPFFQSYTTLLSALTAMQSPADMLQAVLDDFYDDYRVTHFANAELRREDIKGMINFAGQYEHLSDFLADVALAGEFSGENVVEGPVEDKFVTLSTVHQAKGLEWSVVIIPWLADGRFPTDFAINTAEDEEEERRVFHVAVTRAKDELYLVVPQIFSHRSKGPIMMKPSRFLTELDDALTEPLELDEGLPSVPAGTRNSG